MFFCLKFVCRQTFGLRTQNIASLLLRVSLRETKPLSSALYINTKSGKPHGLPDLLLDDSNISFPS